MILAFGGDTVIKEVDQISSDKSCTMTSNIQVTSLLKF